MSWLSLAAGRHELRAVLQRNLDDPPHKEMRLSSLGSMLGLYALLVGDDYHVDWEVERARLLLEKFATHIRPPNPALMSDVLSLTIIAGLGDDAPDYTDIYESIAKARTYKGKRDQSLQLLTERILGRKPVPSKPYKRRGHITKLGQWWRLVEDIAPGSAFDLAVTPEHDQFSEFETQILPLGYLLARDSAGDEWRGHLRQLLAWGSADLENRREVVYERTAKAPPVETKHDPNDEFTWRGFDAVELHGEDVNAYYYLGTNWEAPLFFDESINVYSFLDHVDSNWQLAESALTPELRARVGAAREAGRCAYIVVYDAGVADAPEDALQRARAHYGLDILTKDITEV